MVDSLPPFAKPVVAQMSFLLEGSQGRTPERPTQERRTAFADPSARGIIVARLEKGGIESGKGDQLFR